MAFQTLIDLHIQSFYMYSSNIIKTCLVAVGYSATPSREALLYPLCICIFSSVVNILPARLSVINFIFFDISVAMFELVKVKIM